MVRSRSLIIAICTVVLAAVACDKSGGKTDETSQSTETRHEEQSGGQGEADETPTASDEEATEESSAGDGEWRTVSEEKLDEDGRAMLERARSAQKKLGSQLKEELTRAAADRSFAGAVNICRLRAPEIAKEAADGLDIGRTSHKLRNPENTPPTWAEEAVERKEARQYVFRGPDEQLGYLHPIKLGGMCVNCHGPKDQLADGVPGMLNKHYPKDEATGFEVGDLRGWFWVEVPADS